MLLLTRKGSIGQSLLTISFSPRIRGVVGIKKRDNWLHCTPSYSYHNLLIAPHVRSFYKRVLFCPHQSQEQTVQQQPQQIPQGKQCTNITAETSRVAPEKTTPEEKTDIDSIFKHHYTRNVFGDREEDQELNTLWNEFLDDRSVNTYLHFRAEFKKSKYFNPQNNDIEKVKQMLANQQYEQVLQDKELLKRNIVSICMHKMRGFAQKQMGNEELAIEDMAMASMLLVCIEGTGDGTIDRPFLVLLQEDEKECLKSRGLTAVSKKLKTIGEGEKMRYIEEVYCNEGTYLYFDVTSLHKKPSITTKDLEKGEDAPKTTVSDGKQSST